LLVEINNGDFAPGSVGGEELAGVDIGQAITLAGVIRNDGAIDAWDVNLELTIESQPGLYPTNAAQPDAYSKHFMTIKGDGGTVPFEWTLNAYQAGAYRIELTPSGMDECGWHVKQDNTSHDHLLLLADDSSDYPIQWLLGDAVTAFVGIPMVVDDSINAEITYPSNGDMYFKNVEFEVTAMLTNDGDQTLSDVNAMLMIKADNTGTQIIDPAMQMVGADMDPGDKAVVTWTVMSGSLTGDCVFQLVATGSGTAEMATDTAVVTVKIDPKVTLTITSGANGHIVEPIGGEGNYMYDAGAVIDIEADANPGYMFDEWIGDTAKIDDVTDGSTTIQMNADYEITATFKVADWKAYDIDDDGDINYDEMILALTDYVLGDIDYELMILVLTEYIL
jgi:hypothetical protein